MARQIIHDGKHTLEALRMLAVDIKDAASLQLLSERAAKILSYSVDPISGTAETSYGLLYGLIQSGKTSVITTVSAMAADNGFKCIIILTSDINLLYAQTLKRVRTQLQGLTILGKSDWNDPARFDRQLRTSPFVIVCSKNASHLGTLMDAFKKAGSSGARGLPALIIDDEADQASLNTFTQKNAKQRTEDLSAINKHITELRAFFTSNTYLQVTATPQALFLQSPNGLYRPSFTVLSQPGPGYIGGDKFFGPASPLLEIVDLEEVDSLKSGYQPNPTTQLPPGLKRALFSFLIAASAKNTQDPQANFSFLCHISHTKIDHKLIVDVIDAFRIAAVDGFRDKKSTGFKRLEQGLREEYLKLAVTDPGLPAFDVLLDRIEFLLPGAVIKEVNSNTEEEIAPERVFSIFVGGNKLGRGVTIPNLLTSYYGRNPKRPNSDTVLQHARMYGYRQKHIGVTRLFLPENLANHFRSIHLMEEALRKLIEQKPEGKFEGIFLADPMKATRSSVLDPNAIGVYVAGSWCNPRYPLRTPETSSATLKLDQLLQGFDGKKDYYEVDLDFVNQLVQLCRHDQKLGAELWNLKSIGSALEKLKTLAENGAISGGQKAYLRVSWKRNLNAERSETQGFYDGGEEKKVPSDALTLFMYRLVKSPKGEEVWLPQLRFPEGNYALAFSFDAE